MSLSLQKEKQVLLELFLKISSAASKFDSAAFSNWLSSPFFIYFMRTWANSVPSQLSSIEYVGMVSKYKHGWNSEQGRRHGCRPPRIFSDNPMFSVCANIFYQRYLSNESLGESCWALHKFKYSFERIEAIFWNDILKEIFQSSHGGSRM